MTPENWQPNMEAFFGAFEMTVTAGVVLIVCLIGIVAIRRFTSF